MDEKRALRRFQTSDASSCCEVIKRCIPLMDGLNDAARMFLWTKNSPARLADELQSVFALVYVKDATVLGLGALDSARGEIKRVYIDPQYQHQGIGRTLMLALESEARARGFDRVFVQASPNAVSFYERLGYRFIERARLVIEDAVFQFVHMQKQGLSGHQEAVDG